MNILIVHLEGNFNNNPFLYGLVKLLSERGHRIHILSNASEASQDIHLERVALHLWDNADEELPPDVEWHWVFGVDDEGIKRASQIAEQIDIRLGFISFELEFALETSYAQKNKVIAACRNVEFAVVQDRLRAMLLQVENQIPSDKILTIPLAACGVIQRRSKGEDFRKRHGIEPDEKVAILAGSLAYWTMTNDLLSSANVWPEGWKLLLHERYGLSDDIREHILLNNTSGRVVISHEDIPGIDDMGQVLDAADIGVAFYRGLTEGPLVGSNIRYIGQSSGKISTYLRHGLPVLCNWLGEQSEIINHYGLGFSVSSISDIPKVLIGYKREDYEDNCLDYFSARLDLERNIGELVDVIEGNPTP